MTRRPIIPTPRLSETHNGKTSILWLQREFGLDRRQARRRRRRCARIWARIGAIQIIDETPIPHLEIVKAMQERVFHSQPPEEGT